MPWANSKEKSEALSVKNREKEAREYEGSFLCKEFGSQWEVQIEQDTKDVWEVHIRPSPVDDKSAKISCIPVMKEDGTLSFQSTYAGHIELTDEGFVYTGGKMAPVHFARILQN